MVAVGLATIFAVAPVVAVAHVFAFSGCGVVVVVVVAVVGLGIVFRRGLKWFPKVVFDLCRM